MLPSCVPCAISMHLILQRIHKLKRDTEETSASEPDSKHFTNVCTFEVNQTDPSHRSTEDIFNVGSSAKKQARLALPVSAAVLKN